MILNMKYWCARFFPQIEYFDIRPNLCKNSFIQHLSKMTMYPLQWGKGYVRREQRQHLHQFKKENIGELKTCWNIVFYFDEIEGVLRYKKRDP